MKSDNCRHSFDGGDILLLADDNGLCAERDNERTREQDGADNAVSALPNGGRTKPVII